MTHIFEDIIGTFFHIVIFIIFLSNFNQIRCNFKHLFLFAFIVRLYKPPRAYKNIIVMENGERTYKKLARYFIRGWGKTAKPWYYYNVILKSIKKTSIFYHFFIKNASNYCHFSIKSDAETQQKRNYSFICF